MLPTFKPPRQVAVWSQRCLGCDKPIKANRDEVMKDFETGWWVHVACLAGELKERDGEAFYERLQHFRDSVIDAARCPRCAAPIGAQCRELGSPRSAVHRQRIAAAERASTVVVRSV